MRTESQAPMVPIELDKPRNLVFDIGAQIAIEDQLGLSTFDQEIWKSISAKKALVILWAGLLYEDPSLTLDDTKKIMKGRNMAPIMKKILVAWGWSQPDPEDSQNPPNPDQSPQAGSTSGQ